MKGVKIRGCGFDRLKESMEEDKEIDMEEA
jgi:hypothetical protein